MKELTYTYKDNPYPEGTKEHDIWYHAFVHGLNSDAKQHNDYNLDLRKAHIKKVSRTIRIGKVGILIFWFTRIKEGAKSR